MYDRHHVSASVLLHWHCCSRQQLLLQRRHHRCRIIEIVTVVNTVIVLLVAVAVIIVLLLGNFDIIHRYIRSSSCSRTAISNDGTTTVVVATLTKRLSSNSNCKMV